MINTIINNEITTQIEFLEYTGLKSQDDIKYMDYIKDILGALKHDNKKEGYTVERTIQDFKKLIEKIIIEKDYPRSSRLLKIRLEDTTIIDLKLSLQRIKNELAMKNILLGIDQKKEKEK